MWEALLRRSGTCGICKRAMASLLLSASQKSPPSASQGAPSCFKRATFVCSACSTYAWSCAVRVQTFRPSNKWSVCQQVNLFQLPYQLSCLCPVRQWHKLATNSHAHELDVVLPHFLRQYGKGCLASFTNNAGMYTTVNFQLPWAGWILPSIFPFVNMLHIIKCLYMLCVCVRSSACVWPIWQVLGCNSYKFQYLLGGIDYWQDVTVNCRRHGVAGSVTELRKIS